MPTDRCCAAAAGTEPVNPSRLSRNRQRHVKRTASQSHDTFVFVFFVFQNTHDHRSALYIHFSSLIHIP